MTRGFFVGRFQPYHRGHHEVVREIAEEVDELVVGIGSADASHSTTDPFTGGERVLMVTRAVADLDLPTHVVPIQDIERNAVWVSHVESICPPFDVAYSNNPLVAELFGDAGVPTHETELVDRDVLEGTEIRARMVEGRPWRDLVPAGVAEVVDEVGGVERIRNVSRTDEP
ncbi:MAG: nicotinamide-nucleotide adenylyltransferase [Halobacteriaceae archaeon]